MKTSRILKLMGIILIALALTVQVEANDRTHRRDTKKSVTLTVDKPIIDFVAKVYAEQLQSDDIARVQKMLEQIDHVTICFKDEDACDYVLKFKSLDQKGLEKWMFDAGYLDIIANNEATAVESWMFDADYLE